MTFKKFTSCVIEGKKGEDSSGFGIGPWKRNDGSLSGFTATSSIAGSGEFQLDLYETAIDRMLRYIRSKKLSFQLYRLNGTDLIAEIGGVKKTALAQEKGDRRELAVLSKETGWEGLIIPLLEISFKLSGITPTVMSGMLYVIFRIEFKHDRERLANMSFNGKTLKKAMDSAMVCFAAWHFLIGARKSFERSLNNSLCPAKTLRMLLSGPEPLNEPEFYPDEDNVDSVFSTLYQLRSEPEREK